MLDLVKIPIYKVKEHKTKILDLIAEHKQVIGLDKLLYYFHISRSTYHSWILEIKVKCSSSYFELYVRKYGTQLLKSQVQLIKDALISDYYKTAPLHLQCCGNVIINLIIKFI